MAKEYQNQGLEEFNPYAQHYNPDGIAKSSHNSDSKNLLKNSENNALKQSEPSYYRGSGKSTRAKLDPKSKIPKKRKGMAGIALSLILLIGGALFLGSTNSLLTGAFNDVITEVTDLQHATNTIRGTKIIGSMIEGKDKLNLSYEGTRKYAELPEEMIKNFSRNDIEVETNGNQSQLVFTNDQNQKTVISSAEQLKNTFNDDVDFRDSYNSSRHGRVMSFFDRIATELYSKLGLSRNSCERCRQTTDAEADKKQFNKTMTEETDTKSQADTKASHAEEKTEEYTDSEGNKKTRTVTYDDPTSGSAGGSKSSFAEARNKAQDFLNNTYGGKAVQKATGVGSAAASWSCTFMKLANQVAMLVAANEIYQSIHYFMGLGENPSKTKYGAGNESNINSMLNFMVTNVDDAEYEDYNKVSVSGNIQSAESDGEYIKVGTSKVSGSPIEANGMRKLLTGEQVNTKMANNFSLERNLVILGGTGAVSAAYFKACNRVLQATAVASLAVTFLSGGISTFASYAMGTVISVALNAGFSLALGFMIPSIARAFYSNIFETTKGVPAGEIVARGASAANTRLGRTHSSLAPSSEEALLAFAEVNQEVIALDAEVDRHNHSPFDITSRNTFLGSIAYKFGTTSSTSVIGKIKNLMSTTSSSIGQAIGHSAFADVSYQKFGQVYNDYMLTFGDCPILESIGAKGDMYCNPITVSDVSTLNIEPDDPDYVDAIASQTNCKGNGDCEIIKDSDLAKYIKYCDDRDTPFGAVDSSILTSLTKGAGFIMDLLGSLPVFSDLVDIYTASQDDQNLDWATGQKCVNGSSNPDWSTFKYYQRYVEDQRLLEQMGTYKNGAMADSGKSPVTAFREADAIENPIDNSTAGYLARISGVPKSDVEGILALAEYYNYLGDYDANSRLAMDGSASDIEDSATVISNLNSELQYKAFEKAFETSYQTIAKSFITHDNAFYVDLRNRSYVA